MPTADQITDALSTGLTQIVVPILIFIAALVLSRVVGYVLQVWLARLARRTTTEIDNVILSAARMPLQATIVVAGAQLAVARIAFIPEAWAETIARIFFLVYVVLAFIFAYRLIDGLLDWYWRSVVSQTETDLDDRFLKLFHNLALVLIVVSAIIIVLRRFDIEVSGLVTTLGIGTLAVALAAQETLSDMISGFTIMIDQPYKIGDRIEILDIDAWGDVVDIGLRSTRILTRDNRLVSIPNSVIGKGLVVNYSDPSTNYRVQTHVGIAYGTDLEYARGVMIEALRAEDWVDQGRPIEALLMEFSDSALLFRVRCWIENYVETRRVMDKLNTALYVALSKEGIVIPFPRRDIKLLNQVEAVEASGS